jgi:hypothetical protein
MEDESNIHTAVCTKEVCDIRIGVKQFRYIHKNTIYFKQSDEN